MVAPPCFTMIVRLEDANIVHIYTLSSHALSPPCIRDGETMVLVTKDDVVKLKIL